MSWVVVARARKRELSFTKTQICDGFFLLSRSPTWNCHNSHKKNDIGQFRPFSFRKPDCVHQSPRLTLADPLNFAMPQALPQSERKMIHFCSRCPSPQASNFIWFVNEITTGLMIRVQLVHKRHFTFVKYTTILVGFIFVFSRLRWQPQSEPVFRRAKFQQDKLSEAKFAKCTFDGQCLRVGLFSTGCVLCESGTQNQ